MLESNKANKTSKIAVEKIQVNKFPITLVQFLKWAGLVGTGGEGKELIANGQVLINGEPCLIYGKQLAPGTLISLLEADLLTEVKAIEVVADNN